jgi:hypothetical protein
MERPGVGVLLSVVLLVAGTACGEAEPGDEPLREGGASPSAQPTDTGAAGTYERTLIFLGASADSVLAVPFSFRTVASADGVERQAWAWLDRGGAWEAFFKDSWSTGPTRVPWRLHPRGPIHLVVDQGDIFERVIYEEGPRSLELIPGEVLSDFAGPRGGTYRLQEGALLLGEGRIDGYVLDASLAWRQPAVPAADLVLVVSGDALQVVLAGDDGQPEDGAATPWRAWVRMDFVDRGWEEVDVRWTGSRDFEPARRPVPDGWTWVSPDSAFSGELLIRSSHMEAVEGSGPILPVEAVFEVEGTVTVEDREFPVYGVVRHTQRNPGR